MSDANKAVFLSYASQDAEAAKRICDALRAAGVEVWFDQNELVGGDSWDKKIRGQISSCALFVPIISANTNARAEGYFRLEWKLAVDRSHLLADDHPFLFPIVIGDVSDAAARVPDKFREVQWTRLRLDETPAELALRVTRLLSGAPQSRQGEPRTEAKAGREQRKEQRPAWARHVWAAFGLIIAVYFGLGPIWKPWFRDKTPPSTAQVAPAPKPVLSEARKLANQAMQLLEDPNFTRETSWLADELCQRALALDAGDAEVWAVASFASHNLYGNTYDTSVDRREKARSQAARASQLDPQSVRAALAVALSLRSTGNDEEVLRMLRELHRRAPEDQQVILRLRDAERGQGNEMAVKAIFRELRALPRTRLLPLALWNEVVDLRYQGRFADAEVILDELLSGPEVLRGAYYEKLNLLMRSWHELAETGLFIEKIPARFHQEPAFGSAIAYYWFWCSEPEKALQALSLVSQDYFEEYAAREPKGFLTGWAHAIAGRSAAAQAEWRNALSLVEERLKKDARNYYLLDQRPLLLALTGQREAARSAWQLRVELGGGQNRAGLEAEAQVFLALNESEAAISAIERGWATLTSGPRARILPNLRYHAAYAVIRADPRIQRILAEGAAMLQNLKEQQTGASKLVDAAPAMLSAPAPADKSVAVLAFANLSSDKEQEYFSDGISEELLNVLAKVPGLKVSARTSAFYFKGKEVPIPEIAKQLGVAYVVEGSVRKQGDKVRITAQLIKAADGFHVWSDTFTRDLKDIFAVQDEIAGLIANNLQLKMGMVAARPTIDIEAYQEFLAGRAAAAKASNADLLEAVAHFTKAVAIEPKFTAAWVQLASMHTQLGRWGGAPTLQSWKAARAAIDKARALEPDSPDMLVALGWILRTGEWNWHGAEAAFRRALQLRPNHPETLAGAAVLLYNIGQDAEAFRLGEKAVQLDPLNPSTQLDLSIMFYLSDRFPEGERIARRALALAPGGAGYHSILGWSLMGAGRYDEAVAEAHTDSDEVQRASILGLVAVARGQEAAARAQIARMEEIARTDPDRADLQLTIAWIAAALGDKDLAFASLSKAQASRDPSVAWLRNGSLLAPLFTDPRWDVLLRKVGLADDQLK